MKNEPWQVFFHGNFWGHHGDEPAGEERTLNAHFSWGGRNWFVPAVYVCSSGLVLDLCARVETEDIRAFLEKWNLSLDTREESFSQEELEQIQIENPLHIDLAPTIRCNGKTLRANHSSGFGFNPIWADEMTSRRECTLVMEHYGLDTSCGWSIRRACFGWEEPEAIETLELNMIQQRVQIPGPRFTAQAGEQIGFTHPVTGIQHCIQVHSLERQTLDQAHFGDDESVYPNHFVLMEYSVFPPLSPQELSVLDCAPSDSPRGEKGAVSVGVIAGAHGPVALLPADQQDHRAACSALRFAPQEQVGWRLAFHGKFLEDQKVILFAKT
ncbi:MAG: hypothetical protein E7449_05740 [Ruminococcaceae bacterium]|nr:hypothetical protein [Oscillospiraceae bacterium]